MDCCESRTPRRRILVVDDQESVQELAARILEEAGHTVLRLGNSLDALKLLEVMRPPDLVLLDVSLPEVDGYQVAVAMKSSRRTDRIPILFMSGIMTGPWERKVAEFSGGSAFLAKPFSPDVLYSLVSAYLGLANVG